MTASDAPCGAPTNGGGTCTLPPMTGTGGLCHNHATLDLTEAQLAAARANPVKHGLFATGACSREDELIYDQIAAELQGKCSPSTAQFIAALGMRAHRAVRWEARQGGAISPDVTKASQAFLGARLRFERPAEEGDDDHECLDDVEVTRQVQGLLQDPEFILETVRPTILQTVVQRYQEKAARLPDPAEAGKEATAGGGAADGA